MYKQRYKGGNGEGNMRRNLRWSRVRANMKMRLGTGNTTLDIENVITVGNIVSRRPSTRYNRNSGTVRRWTARISSYGQDVYSSCRNGQYLSIIFCRHQLSYLQLIKFACWKVTMFLWQITLTAAVTVQKCMIHYNSIQIERRVCITSILNERCHPPPPLDDPGLAVLGTDRVWPGLRLWNFLENGQVTNLPQSSKKIVTEVDRNPTDNRSQKFPNGLN